MSSINYKKELENVLKVFIKSKDITKVILLLLLGLSFVGLLALIKILYIPIFVVVLVYVFLKIIKEKRKI